MAEQIEKKGKAPTKANKADFMNHILSRNFSEQDRPYIIKKGALFMKKLICSPGSYIQAAGEFSRLAEHTAALGSAAYLIVDSYIDSVYHDQLASSFEKDAVPFQAAVFGGECSMDEIWKHQAALGNSDVIIGIGGGKTLDTSKAVAQVTNHPVIVVPTAASSDAPCSRLSVIYTPEGAFDQYLPLKTNPAMVIVDTEVVAKAPVRFLVAGIGDALATYYEAAACAQSNAVTMAGGHTTRTALALARLCLDTLLEDGVKAVAAVKLGLCTQAVENVIEANTYLSGIGFESGGLSGAHAVHNGLTALPGCHKMLHGEKVAFGVLTQLVLENRPLEEIKGIIAFCKEVGLPTTLTELGLADVSDEELIQAAKAACAEGDTMGNLPFEVTEADVFAAMKTADQLSKMR